MKVKLITGESFGTRSMATFIETEDINILIDPGVALAPKRFGLPPHPIELEKLENDWKSIVSYAHKSDLVIITHYHYDHFSPKRYIEDIYTGKKLFLKNPNEMINFNQKRRAHYFIKQIEPLVEFIKFADGKEYILGNTKIVFSNPVPHGMDSKLGYVLEVAVSNGKHTFLYTSDVEGLTLDEQISFVVDMNPDIVYVDGPTTYLINNKCSEEDVNLSIINISSLLNLPNLKVLIIDHHLVRDANWDVWIFEILETAKRNKIWIGTAAEFMGLKPNLLEAFRRELYEKYPVR